jgi:hypothetical protein
VKTLIKKGVISLGEWKVNAMCFIPGGDKKDILGIFTHGYTSHKGSILTWPDRLSDMGIPSIIFDLPGHFLGSYNDVNDFSKFKKNSHLLFSKAWDLFKDYTKFENKPIMVLGGHSLGALLALKAMDLEDFAHLEKYAICVGLGLPPEKGTHLFETGFFAKTMNLRSQMVSSELCPENVLPWIKKEKWGLGLKDKNIYLLVGEDDAIVSLDEAQDLVDLLKKNGNRVNLKVVKKLPHHMPDTAAFYIKKILQDEII